MAKTFSRAIWKCTCCTELTQCCLWVSSMSDSKKYFITISVEAIRFKLDKHLILPHIKAIIMCRSRLILRSLTTTSKISKLALLTCTKISYKMTSSTECSISQIKPLMFMSLRSENICPNESSKSSLRPRKEKT